MLHEITLKLGLIRKQEYNLILNITEIQAVLSQLKPLAFGVSIHNDNF